MLLCCFFFNFNMNTLILLLNKSCFTRYVLYTVFPCRNLHSCVSLSVTKIQVFQDLTLEFLWTVGFLAFASNFDPLSIRIKPMKCVGSFDSNSHWFRGLLQSSVNTRRWLKNNKEEEGKEEEVLWGKSWRKMQNLCFSIHFLTKVLK